ATASSIPHRTYSPNQSKKDLKGQRQERSGQIPHPLLAVEKTDHETVRTSRFQDVAEALESLAQVQVERPGVGQHHVRWFGDGYGTLAAGEVRPGPKRLLWIAAEAAGDLVSVVYDGRQETD